MSSVQVSLGVSQLEQKRFTVLEEALNRALRELYAGKKFKIFASVVEDNNELKITFDKRKES